ncbi:MAG: DNA gyrase inhibitor YacG [Alphaproteobacteria bacterium]|nr:DNA gyrase inhibitor YacG [Alphaproteobacteria bacterium]MBV8549631.1 DNA gyrase inhibitor YacG [Alphaproteobacteria bacterium]
MAQAALKPCPLCGKIAVESFSPFCSKRCANVDLGRWLGENYRIETDEGAVNDDNPENA